MAYSPVICKYASRALTTNDPCFRPTRSAPRRCRQTTLDGLARASEPLDSARDTYEVSDRHIYHNVIYML